MAFWSKFTPSDRKAHPDAQPSAGPLPASTDHDDRLPGIAGYQGYRIGKNAMPENRFRFVRPGDQQQR